MNQHLQKSIEKYESIGEDIRPLLTWHLEHGIVVCNHDSFALGYYTTSSDIGLPVTYNQSDSLFVTMCAGDMRKALEPFANDFDYIAFKRQFKNSNFIRTYEMNKFLTKLYK